MGLIKRYPGYKFLKVLCQGSLSTYEIVKEVGCPYKTGYEKLNELERIGLVRSERWSKKRIWHLTLEPPHAEYAVNKSFAEVFSKIPNDNSTI
ncbi:MAG: transcriptional regulator [Methanophagales archaeon ANME-1-THS]|nr:MAG: transcriptional regulator [Methanophagales archaeon ANME-1-THS]